MTSARKLFEDHLQSLRELATKMENVSFEDVLGAISKPSGHTMMLSDLLADQDTRINKMIEWYRPMFYERLIDEQVKILNDRWPIIKLKPEEVSAAIKKVREQQENLAAGRKKGVLARQEKASKNQSDLNSAIAALFDTPEKPGWIWSNPQIVRYLKKHNFEYADSTILAAVKREKAMYRKARKEQQDSEFLNR